MGLFTVFWGFGVVFLSLYKVYNFSFFCVRLFVRLFSRFSSEFFLYLDGFRGPFSGFLRSILKFSVVYHIVNEID